MKTFQINYKLWYRETSDWGMEIIKARNKESALKKFCSLKKLNKNLYNPEDWYWSEGVWYAKFKSIREIKIISCPKCNGSGHIFIEE